MTKMEIRGIDDWFVEEMLFSQYGAEMPLDEAREKLEWEIASYWEEFEDADDEPVISPYSLYMVEFVKRTEEIKDIMSRSMTEYEQLVAQAIYDRCARIERMRAAKGN